MAYLAFHEIGGAAVAGAMAASSPRADAVPADIATLTALEWSVVRLARRDGPSSLLRPGRLASAWRTLFKLPNPQLADTRLEALRRMAVLTWRHGYTVPSREVSRFLAAGFSPAQYETMVDHIKVARTPRPRGFATQQAPALL